MELKYCIAIAALLFAIVQAEFQPSHYSLEFDFVTTPAFHGKVKIHFTYKGNNEDKIALYFNTESPIFETKDVSLLENGTIPRAIISVERLQDHQVQIALDSYLTNNAHYILEIEFKGSYREDGIWSTRKAIYLNFLREEEYKVFPTLKNDQHVSVDLKLIHSSSWTAYSFTDGSRKDKKDSAETVFSSTNTSISLDYLNFAIVGDYNTAFQGPINLIIPKSSTLDPIIEKCTTIEPFKEMYEHIGKPQINFVAIEGYSDVSKSHFNLVFLKSSLIERDPEMTTDNKADLCLTILQLIESQFYGIRLDSSESFFTKAVPHFLSIEAFKQLSDFWSENFIKEKVTQIMELGFEEKYITISSSDEEDSKAKGAAFLSMLDEYIQRQNSNSMSSILTSYFQERFKVGEMVTTNDFFNYIQKYTFFKDIDEWNNWMGAKDIPLVTVNTDKSITCNGTEELVFPVFYTEDGKDVSKFVMCNGSSNIKNTHLIYLNPTGTGLYRAKYDDSIWKKLQTDITKYLQDVRGRSRLIKDALYSAKDSDLTSLNVLNYLINEYDCLPWKLALEELNNWRNLFWDKRTRLDKKMKQLLLYVREYYGYGSSSNHTINLCRKVILQGNVDFGYSDVSANLLEMYYKVKWNVSDIETVGSDVWQVAGCAWLQQNGERAGQQFSHMYSKDASEFKKKRLFEIWACSNQKSWVLKNIFSMSSSSDRECAFDYLISRSDAVESTLKRMLATLKGWMLANYTDKLQILSSMMNKIAPKLSRNEVNDTLHEMEDVCDDPGCTDLREAIKNARQSWENNIEWINNTLNSFETWLKTPPNPVDPSPPPLPTDSPSPTTTTGSSTSGPTTSSPTGSTNPSSSTTHSSASLPKLAFLLLALPLLPFLQ